MAQPGQRLSSGVSLALGAVFITIGGLALFGQYIDVDVGRYGWPLFIIVPGVALLVAGFAAGASSALVPGTVITTVGLVLAYQNATDHWESWAYAWALVGPGAAGLGTMLAGWRTRDRESARAGTRTALTGLGLFLAGAVFFEGVIGISGRRFGALVDIGIPLLLIGLGGFLLLGRRRA